MLRVDAMKLKQLRQLKIKNVTNIKCKTVEGNRIEVKFTNHDNKRYRILLPDMVRTLLENVNKDSQVKQEVVEVIQRTLKEIINNKE